MQPSSKFGSRTFAVSADSSKLLRRIRSCAHLVASVTLGAWILASVGCGSTTSTADETVGRVQQAANFATAKWKPLEQNGAFMGDPVSDGANNGREIVGDVTYPAVYIYADDTDFGIRLRLDDSAVQSNKLRPYGWGILFDTNGDFSAYEFSFMADGTGAQRVVFAQNTSPGTTGTPQDSAETELSSIAVTIGATGNLQSSAADSAFNGTPDYFLDFSMPLSVLKAAGISLSTPLRIIAGSSSSANSISVDLAGTALSPGTGTLAASVSDPKYLDGSDGDTDNDGVLNPADRDNDNDGIADYRENTFGVDPDADHDNDGIPNFRDASDRGDGTAAGCTDSAGDGVCDVMIGAFDADGDGIPNHNDLDSDNDGIGDLREAGHGKTDANNDGMVDGSLGTNGFLNVLETTADSGIQNYQMLDTENDGTRDFLDLDSDGDGSFDIVETGRAALDVNGNGRVDSTTDVDADGLMATVDANAAAYGFPSVTLTDADSDGIFNPYDRDNGGPGDCDSDGLTDSAECPGGWPCPDGNGDGVPNYMTATVDTDGDGVANEDDSAPTNPNICHDFDADSCNDCAITGANGSGGSTTNDGTDTDGDGLCNAGDPDDDNDGVSDGSDTAPTNPLVCRDLDSDSCNDCAITGANGSGGSVTNDGTDTDSDGQCDAGDADDDNDGVIDSSDSAPLDPLVCRDVDNDSCDDCGLTGANGSGGSVTNDGTDTDSDGLCNVGDVDDDNDGVVDASDSAPLNANVCRDTDSDTCDDCSLTGANGSGGNPANDGTDLDADGLCNAGDLDDDADGVVDVADSAPLNPNVCRDTDTDACDDCAVTGANGSGGNPANDGLDTDADGICDSGDPDLDNDGVPDVADSAPLNPLVCRDLDNDSCDDCSLTGANGSGGNITNDGTDQDNDGLCDKGDLDDDNDGVTDAADAAPSDPYRCRDLDDDSCSDCAITGANGSGGSITNDGLDSDSDGLCDAGDPDNDNDGVTNAADSAPTNPLVCRDLDADSCDDCAVTGADNSGGNVANDGTDTDGDGKCDLGDSDDDQDGVADALDSAPLDPNTCRDVDNDTCNDCAVTGANGSGGNPANDGIDLDNDGLCNAGDLDDDNDGVADATDSSPTNANVCRDTDTDGCDDCAVTGADGSGGNPKNDGADLDADGKCDLGDSDADDDGVPDAVDVAPTNPNSCRDLDGDSCDDCVLTGANSSGGDITNDGTDTDSDGHCDAGDADDDNDGVPDGSDAAPTNPNRCRDVDNDSCDDCAITGNNGSGGSVANDGPDADGDGLCNAGDPDNDNDGVVDASDSAPLNPSECRDADNDSCDDCKETGANGSGGDTRNDGPDSDDDGRCNAGDNDDDNDGVLDSNDTSPQNAEVCRDVDSDGCDDCSVTRADGSGGSTANDGLDSDGDGICDAGDPDDDNDGVLNLEDSAPLNPTVCRDTDRDTCDDCTFTSANGSGGDPANDGPDFDRDGQCNAGDSDTDNDGVPDVADSAPTNANVCRDRDNDTCDDCSVTGANLSGGSLTNDGLDSDLDGLCDAGDPDDDGDGVVDASDSAPLDARVCADSDSDSCDDCSITGPEHAGAAPSNDGVDTDGDGRCNAGDTDDDNDGVADASDSAPLDINVCGDSDKDSCDDCSVTGIGHSGANAANDGLDSDLDGLCNLGDPDDDNDGVVDASDSAPQNSSVCSDVDGDTCDDCAVTGATHAGASPANDGLDSDSDGLCDAGDPDDDNDGTLDPVDASPTNPSVCVDADGDGCNDCAVTGANGSGGNPANDGTDTDQDGQCDAGDSDDDNDGVADNVDRLATDPRVCRDTDKDACDDCSVTGPNGSGGDPANDGTDLDRDGICDASEDDTDGDGVADDSDLAVRDPKVCRDADHDSCDDCSRSGANGSGGEPLNDGTDSDNDGICDAGESDSDGDGVADPGDSDRDNDGIVNVVEGTGDTDGDGIPNELDLDSDGDGIPDTTEVGLSALDRDGDGRLDDVADADGDGVVDTVDTDAANAQITTSRVELSDTDGDGHNDVLDLDSDGDGMTDCFEAGGTDADGDGKLDGDTDKNANGLVDSVDLGEQGVPLKCPDTDRDGQSDWLDTDSDADGVADAIEAYDTDADGIPEVEALNTDEDGDGLDDAFDLDASGSLSDLPDLDDDKKPDFRDVDDDGDGIETRYEDVNGDGKYLDDTDEDGKPNYLDRDDDGDKLETDEEMPDRNGDGNPSDARDSDDDGAPDFLDEDDDGDGTATSDELSDTNGNGKPDYLEPKPGEVTKLKRSLAGGGIECSIRLRRDEERGSGTWIVGLALIGVVLQLRRRNRERPSPSPKRRNVG